MSLTYPSYLRLDELLGLQRPKSDPPEHDELLFIVIHQVYELWFKQMLHELEALRDQMQAARVYDAIGSLKRIRMVMKTLVTQVDILETMTPMSFASFRNRLDTASGFQSAQFREIEFLLGYKRPALSRDGSPIPNPAPLARRLTEPTVMDGLYALMAARGFPTPPDLASRAPEAATTASEAFQGQILEAYRTQPELAFLFEAMLDLDEGIQEWRYRHVKLTERTIGMKLGTGGSSGVEFLKASLFRPLFPDLWAVRVRM